MTHKYDLSKACAWDYASAKAAVSEVKPRNRKNVKVRIGNVQFNSSEIDIRRARSYFEDGKVMYEVPMANGSKIVFPQQHKEGCKSSVFLSSEKKKKSSYSLSNYRSGYIDTGVSVNVDNIDNAKIYGSKYYKNTIYLEGESFGNEIYVNPKGDDIYSDNTTFNNYFRVYE